MIKFHGRFCLLKSSTRFQRHFYIELSLIIMKTSCSRKNVEKSPSAENRVKLIDDDSNNESRTPLINDGDGHDLPRGHTMN